MEKIVIYHPGGYNRLKFESFPEPLPKENQVLVQTKAIGVNYADCVVRMGYYASAREYVGWPITPGFEFAGIVSTVGKNVKDMPVGTRVFGVSRFDAYATHVVVPRHQVYALPDHISFEEAAGFPVIYLTAHYALNMLVHIFPGSTILVHSSDGR
jgi:NADPH:quinone reductase-like Zn-dependent oxidoreductase